MLLMHQHMHSPDLGAEPSVLIAGGARSANGERVPAQALHDFGLSKNEVKLFLCVVLIKRVSPFFAHDSRSLLTYIKQVEQKKTKLKPNGPVQVLTLPSPKR